MSLRWEVQHLRQLWREVLWMPQLQLWNNRLGKANVMSKWNWKYPNRGCSKYFGTLNWIHDTIREMHISFQMTFLQAFTFVIGVQTVRIERFVLIVSWVLEALSILYSTSTLQSLFSDANKVNTSFHIPQSWLYFWLQEPAVSDTFMEYFLWPDRTWLHCLLPPLVVDVSSSASYCLWPTSHKRQHIYNAMNAQLLFTAIQKMRIFLSAT